MKKKSLSAMNLGLYIGLFLFLIFIMSGEMNAFVSEDDLFIKTVGNIMSQDEIQFNYEVLIHTQEDILGSLVLEGDTKINRLENQQSGRFNIQSNSLGLEVLEGKYTYENYILTIELPMIYQEPFIFDLRAYTFDVQDSNYGLELEVFKGLKATFMGRESVEVRNEKDKIYKEWLYKYDIEWPLDEIIKLQSLGLELVELNQIMKGQVYVDKDKNLRKVEIQVEDLETSTVIIEAVFILTQPVPLVL
jgi:hypothetical protein